VRVLVCVTSVAVISFKLKLQLHLVAEIKHYVRKRQLLTLFVIPPVVVAARGHAPAPKALLQSAYDFLLDFNRNYVSILYRFRDIAGYWSKVADFDPPHQHSAPSYGVTPVEYRGDLWRQ